MGLSADHPIGRSQIISKRDIMAAVPAAPAPFAVTMIIFHDEDRPQMKGGSKAKSAAAGNDAWDRAVPLVF